MIVYRFRGYKLNYASLEQKNSFHFKCEKNKGHHLRTCLNSTLDSHHWLMKLNICSLSILSKLCVESLDVTHQEPMGQEGTRVEKHSVVTFLEVIVANSRKYFVSFTISTLWLILQRYYLTYMQQMNHITQMMWRMISVKIVSLFTFHESFTNFCKKIGLNVEKAKSWKYYFPDNQLFNWLHFYIAGRTRLNIILNINNHIGF